jgi:hypothetical protein
MLYNMWWALGMCSLIIYYVVRFGQGQRNVILCGEDLGEVIVIVYYGETAGKGQGNCIVCVECW